MRKKHQVKVLVSKTALKIVKLATKLVAVSHPATSLSSSFLLTKNAQSVAQMIDNLAC